MSSVPDDNDTTLMHIAANVHEANAPINPPPTPTRTGRYQGI